MIRNAIFAMIAISLSGCVTPSHIHYQFRENVSVKEDFTVPNPKPVATVGAEFTQSW